MMFFSHIGRHGLFGGHPDFLALLGLGRLGRRVRLLRLLRAVLYRWQFVCLHLSTNH